MKNKLLISNVLMDGIAKIDNRLKDMQFGSGFGTWEQYIINNEHYKLHEYGCIVIVLDGDTLWENYPDIMDFRRILSSLSVFACKNSGIKIYISNIECKLSTRIDSDDTRAAENFEHDINEIIYTICDGNSKITCLNIKKIITEMGESSFYSKKMEYMSSCPYSISALKRIASEIMNMDYFRSSQRKKCIVLDFDNTLWGGVIGEDGEDNILISKSKEGKQYYDFQQVLIKIKNKGILLAAASKNNEDDVKNIFCSNKMPLKDLDFVIKKIGWSPKSESIKEIAHELNIGLESIVFVDDNPAERHEVKASLSEVEVPDFPTDPSELEKFGRYLYDTYFHADKITAEDTQKTEMYAANRERDKLRESGLSIEDYLKSLQMKLNVIPAENRHQQRIFQLINKTNQFNLTTKRYTEDEVYELLQSPDALIYIGDVMDRFGDNGITNLCIIKCKDEIAYIDEFLMSCRVMERRIEYDFLRCIEKDLFNHGMSKMQCCFVQTSKNMPSSDFLENYGFKKISDDALYQKEIRSESLSGLIKVEML